MKCSKGVEVLGKENDKEVDSQGVFCSQQDSFPLGFFL